MQVDVEQNSPCEVELNIEIPAEQVSAAKDRVYKEIGRYAAIPGFRKGKAPRAILERHVSEETVRRHLLDELLPKAYAGALEENKIEPYADPDIDIVTLEDEQPFVFKAKVPLPPKVELGEYRGIEVERTSVSITDQDVEAEVSQLREQRAAIEGVEGRGVQSGDLAIVEMKATVEGEEPGEPRRTLIRVGSNIPVFDQQLIGVNLEEEKSFTVKYPSDIPDESLAGKNVDYTIKVEGMREVKLPELDDEFAKTVGEFESLDALHDDIRTKLTDAANREADSEVENRIIEEIVSRSEVSFPEVMVKARAAHQLEHLREGLEKEGRTLKQYLEQLGKSREEFMADLNEAVSRRVKVGLVLGHLAEQESLRVTDEEIEAEMVRLEAAANAPREAVEAYLESRGGRDGLEEAMLDRKISEFILSVSTVKSGESGKQST